MRRNVIRLSTKVSVALLLLIIGVFWGLQASGQEWSATQKEIWQMEELSWWSLEQGDLDGYLKTRSEDYIGWPTWTKGPVTKAFIKNNMNMQHTTVSSYNLEPLAVKIFGNVAIAMFVYHMEDGLGNIHRVGVTHTWMKQGGEWKIIGSMTASCLKPHFCPEKPAR